MNKQKPKTLKKESPWKQRRSELDGFSGTYYMNHQSGDYLRVDYSPDAKRVRLYAEVLGDCDNAHFSVIESGNIVEPKGRARSRAADVFIERREIFSTIPDRKILRLIDGIYGIGLKNAVKLDTARALPQQNESSFLKFAHSILERYGLLDAFDFGIGFALCAAALYFSNLNFALSGAICSVYGIIIGGIDIFVRKRRPLFSKILIFLFSGLVMYLYSRLY